MANNIGFISQKKILIIEGLRYIEDLVAQHAKIDSCKNPRLRQTVRGLGIKKQKIKK